MKIDLKNTIHHCINLLDPEDDGDAKRILLLKKLIELLNLEKLSLEKPKFP
jgi:hypothetical protein